MKSIYYIFSLLTISILFSLSSCNKSDSSGITPVSGTGGSLARFTLSGNYLYAVDHNAVKSYFLHDDGSIEYKATVQIADDIETIYPYQNKLFIGSKAAMYIYNLNNPAVPEYEQMASHVRACDPVVAQDDLAYVTVRSGSSCGGTINALYIYQVGGTTSSISNPQLLNTYNLTNPYGLGIKGSTLYVCDGVAGLRVLDVSDPLNIATLGNRAGYTFYDCIPYGNTLLCMVEGGMVIYDITQTDNPQYVAQTF